MKTRYYLFAVSMAVLGSLLTMLIYPRLGHNSKKNNFAGEGTDPSGKVTLTRFDPTDQSGPVDFTFAANQTVQAVVHVKIISTVPGEEINDPITEFFYGHAIEQPPQKVTGYGSGVIISPDGYIVTNNHVVENSDSIGVVLNNNKTYRAKLIGRDPDSDLALIRIDARDLPIIKFGDSDNLELGQWVLAVGNPFNLGTTVTSGIISAKGRSLELPGDDNFKIESYLQTDAALNPGNSGGALVNIKSELVGITAAIISPTGAFSGNSFAIPVNLVKKVVTDLREFGKVHRGLLGITISEVTPELAAREKLSEVTGVLISEVSQGGGAAEAGLKAKDIILKIDNIGIGSPSDLQERVNLHRPGDRLNITYSRNGVEKTVPVVLKIKETDKKADSQKQ